MTKQEQLARLALARATMRDLVVVIATDNQRKMVQLLRSIDPLAIISTVGADGIRLHGKRWGHPPAIPTGCRRAS